VRSTPPRATDGGPGAHQAGAADASSILFVEVVRLCIVAVATAAGYEIGEAAPGDQILGSILGASIGYVIGGVVGRILRQAMGSFEAQVERTPAAQVMAGTLGGLLLGALGALMGIAPVVFLPGAWGWPVFGLLVWLGVYAGFQTGARKGEELAAMIRRTSAAGFGIVPERRTPPGGALVDTSAVIDGRLLAVADAGFLPGPLLVPTFVLDELQGIADAQEPRRRRRGKRGLEILDALRSRPGDALVVIDDDVPELEAVDAKLIALAKRLETGLVTVDENLQRVAELQGIRCLSLHRLADGLRAPLVPGEAVTVTVVKEGREPGQGIGFLDDGTMVVVTDAASLIGRDVDAVVTSSVQTAKGRMFFASLTESGPS